MEAPPKASEDDKSPLPPPVASSLHQRRSSAPEVEQLEASAAAVAGAGYLSPASMQFRY